MARRSAAADSVEWGSVHNISTLVTVEKEVPARRKVGAATSSTVATVHFVSRSSCHGLLDVSCGSDGPQLCSRNHNRRRALWGLRGITLMKQ